MKISKTWRTIAKIQALVDDLETNQLPNNASRLWLQDLKNILNDAEYFLDEIALELERRNYGDDATLISSKQHSTSLIDESCIVGRDWDKNQIVTMLCSEFTEEKAPSVISIVGMGGIGKTTLAQLAYNDMEIMNNFETRIWVSVSVQFDMLRITKTIFESVTKKVADFSDLNRIQIELQDVLKSKRFLLVLDNVWNECPSDWDILQQPFKAAASGSKILVTTRSVRVSTVFGSRFTYHMQPLSEEDCWELTKNIVLKSNSLQLHQDLEMIDSKIAKKCEGLPLAAKMIGNVLCFKSGEMQLDDLLQVELWDMARNINEIYPSLKLSYDHLPACMKRCFVYCSIFPYNFEFNKDDLINYG
ncbi:hypothetical protein FNV43_RR00216 [Rhamnella rubrinervis]|uniref:NB-ARC domain-containing protein n=1 Tax=Rhamnella rubrinervis TaxID=2594499 RepID=A0A8K0HP53_9ROSA|nr:hypothetical protein FNV43_RR00216 [Rhamnella rubrinervis]